MAKIVHPLTSFRKRQNPQQSQEDFGLKVSVTGMTVYRWEVGMTLPRASLMPRLTRITGISPTEFYAAYHALQRPKARPRKRAA